MSLKPPLPPTAGAPFLWDVLDLELDTTGSTTAAPKEFMFSPVGSGEAWRFGGAGGVGFQAANNRMTDLYSNQPIRLLGRGTGATPPAYATGATTDAAVCVDGTATNRPLFRLKPASGMTSQILEIYDAAGVRQGLIDKDGHIGLAGKTNPQNAYIYVGTGGGAMTDKQVMGLKVKLDTPADGTADGIQSNIRVIDGSGERDDYAIIGGLDIDGVGTTGASVAVWGSTLVNAPAEGRRMWGANILTSLRNTAVGYASSAVGAEIGFFNSCETDSAGGNLTLPFSGTDDAAFSILFNTGSADVALPGRIKTAMMIPHDGDTGGRAAPSEYVLWYGDCPANVPSGVPSFMVDHSGNISAKNLGSGHSTGEYAPTVISGSANTALTAQRVEAVRMVCRRSRTIDTISFAVNALDAADPAAIVGIYDSTGARLAKSNSTTGKLNATGLQTVALTASVTLTAGNVYYVAFLCPAVAVTATLAFATFGNNTNNVAQMLGSGFPDAEFITKTGETDLPATLSSVASTSTGPVLGVLE